MYDEDRGRRKVGRPMDISSKGKFYGKCDVRLTKEKDLELTRLAEKYGVTRSDVMRLALDDLLRFNSKEE